MPIGFIDGITSAGLVEGWAYDENKPLEPLLVAIVDLKDDQIAVGMANLFRKDLAETNHAYGWCHFRLYVNKPYDQLKTTALKLVSVETNYVLHSPEKLRYEEATPYSVSDVLELESNDPTVIKSLDQIETFEDIFNNFIRAKGVDAFVRAAYVYVLGRSIDDEGIILYSRLIRQNRLSPYAMLRTLADSAEFRERPRSLVAPTQPGFPFRVG